MNKQAIKILSLVLVLAASSSVAFAQKVWKGSWATAVEWTGKGDMPKIRFLLLVYSSLL